MDRFRAVALVSLLVLSLLAGTGVFAGVAAADEGSVAFDASTYSDGDTVTVIVEDGDLSTTEDYVVNVQSDTESQVEVTGERTGTSTVYTTDKSVADENADNKITKSDIEYRDYDGSGNQIKSTSRNINGTVTITFENPPGANDAIYYTRGETILLDHDTEDRFTGSTTVNSTDSIGTLQVNDGDTINTSYFDNSQQTNLTTTALIDNDPGELILGPITELTTDSFQGTTLTHTESVIEVPFNEDVSKAGGESGNLTLGGNITVAVDGENVTDRYALDANGSTDGQVVLSSGTAVDPRADLTVAIDAVNDSADTETISPGAVEATVAAGTVIEGDEAANAYENETVAFVAGDADQAFEVENDSGSFVFAGRTGAGSQVFAFDTAARNWSGGYTIESVGADGSVEETTEFVLRDLDLAVDVESRNLTTADGIEGRIEAVAGDRTVETALRDADGDVVNRTNYTLDGNGEREFEFAADSVADAGPGNYTVVVTDAGSNTSVDSAQIRVVDADLRTASFRSNVVTEHAGDVATVEVELAYTDTATVTIGGPEVGFRANATVEDRDGDGTVRLRFNTAAVANTTTLPDDGGDVFGVASADGDDASDAVVESDIDGENAPNESLDPAEYDLAVRNGSNATAPATHVGLLVLETPAPERLSNWVAPSGSDLSTTAEVSAAIEAGHLTRARDVAMGDVVVHRLVAPGLAGAFARQSGNATESFFELAGTAGSDLYGLNVTQRNPGPNRYPYRLELNESNTRVVADARNDTYFVIYDSAEPAGTPWNGSGATGATGSVTPEVGDGLTADVTVRDDGPFEGLERDKRRVTANYSLVEGRIATDVDRFVVANATNQTISGTATVAPGTELDVRVRSDNGTEPRFLKTTHAVVGPDGEWTATLDFESQDVGDSFTVTAAADIVDDADELAVEGVVRAVVTPTATPTTTVNTTTATGGGGSGGGGGFAGDSDSDSATKTRTATATPSPTPEPDDSVVDSAQQFLGGVLGTFADDSGDESLRSRLLGFDVVVSAVALLAVALYVSTRE